MSEKKKNTVTSKDIARECGVSQATVSYVINNKAGKRISEEKRQEILEAARRLNYFPNASARSIRQQSCTSVGLLPGNNYPTLVSAIPSGASKNTWTVSDTR